MVTAKVWYTQSGPSAQPSISNLRPRTARAQPISLEYVNEGNANVIFRIRSSADGDDLPDLLRHRLLRLRKDKSFIRPTQEQYSAFKAHFVPLFQPDYLIEQDLVHIDQGLASVLNGLLGQLETSGVRPKSRHEDILAINEPYGLLMTDMTTQVGEIQLELKPKWLVQSPNAPKNATRCRTCALRACRQTDKSKDGATSDAASFCPLGLLSNSSLERRKAFEAIFLNQSLLSNEIVQKVTQALAKETLPVITDLQRHQARLDERGILDVEPEHIPDDYLKAMTLRDCVLLIKESHTQGSHVFETRLADLDLKHAHPDKVLKWKETERTLVDEGWYTNTGIGATPEEVCILRRQSKKATS